MWLGNRISRSYKSSASSAVEFSMLEARTMFCSPTVADGGPLPSAAQVIFAAAMRGEPHKSSASASVPALSSLPGAKATIYLDFEGDVAQRWGTYDVPATPAYSGSSDDIIEIWTRVSEKYSAFDINVTTVNPGSFANGRALKVVIGGNGSWSSQTAGGLSYVGSFTSQMPNVSFVFADNLGAGYPQYVAEAISHECGHSFGLEHQSVYADPHSRVLGAKVSEYSDNDGSTLTAPTMGNSYSAARGLWWTGDNSDGTSQDDMSVIASSANGFGFRPDDYSNSITTAKSLKLSSGHVTVHGDISSPRDKDCFAITVGKGALTLKVRGVEFGATLDATLSIYTTDGTLVGRANTANLNENLTRNLAAGKYVAVVSSHGSYGDVGQYTLYAYGETPSTNTTVAKPLAVTNRVSATNANPFSTQPIRTTLANDLIV